MVVISSDELLSTSLPLSSLLRDRELLLSFSDPEDELLDDYEEDEAERDRLLRELSLSSLSRLYLLF